MTRTVFRTCTLCEANCGLHFEVDGEKIVSVRGDQDDVFSKGYACAKGIAIAEIQEDPDRLRRPMRRTPAGKFEPIDWDDAFDEVVSRIQSIQRQHGKDAVALYIGNPIIHNHGALLVRNGLLQALGSKNAYSASSQDTAPRFATSYYLYGSALATPVPDVDRSSYFLCIGANPVVSNGSAFTAPNLKGRLRDLRARGGKLVVVDPRRTETAREADEYVPIRPAGDTAFLLGMIATLVDQKRVDAGFLADHCNGWAQVAARIERLDRRAAAEESGVPWATIERLALEFAEASEPTAYSRIGVCNSRHGTIATFATDLLNIAAGRLGRIGGAMFTSPALDLIPVTVWGNMDGHDRWRSRVRGLPETLGDLPSACLAEEIETPGAGQVRAMITFAGNPVLSAPNSRRMARAFEKLDFSVAIDLYINETTRHADIILPPAWSLAEEHIDLLFPAFMARNIARWSPPVVERKAGEWHDWEILLEIATRLGGGPYGVGPLDTAYRAARRLGLQWDPMQGIEMLLRIGRHGDHYLPWSDGLNLKKLKAAPHGIDLGPLESGIAHRVTHKDGRVNLAAAPMLAGLDKYLESQKREDDGKLLLIGRREVRTNNSWMHNAPSMVAGRDRCLLYVHPDDAAKAGVQDGSTAILENHVHRGPVPIHVTDEVMPGVVSLPHGWGHADSAEWQSVAGRSPGVSANDWTDDAEVEAVVGQSILNGVPVALRAE